VRGILPVISRMRMDHDGAGSLHMWGDEVPVTADVRDGQPVLETSPDAHFPLVIRCTVNGDVLRMRFTNVGVEFDLTFDRAGEAEIAAHAAAQPVATPAPVGPDVTTNGLATAPPMGWNSWYGLRLRITDELVREVADALVEMGLRDAGYTFVTLDDGWQGGRGADGEILPNRGFPDMPTLGRKLHDLGLGFGIYSSPGPATCADYTGSFGYEEQDARTFARWGVDFLKYDWCSAGALYRTEEEMRGIFQRMGRALRESGRPIVFSLCQYGAFDVPRWGATVGGNLWRVSYDVEDRWESIEAIGFAEHSTPVGGWNDLDMLQIGLGGLSDVEYRTQMAIWAMRSAPLILSCDPRDLSASELHILTNRDIIAIDQDPLAAPVERHRIGAVDVWVKRLRVGHAVAFLNRTEDVVEARMTWEHIGLAHPARTRDAWTGVEAPASPEWSVALAAHESIVLRLLS